MVLFFVAMTRYYKKSPPIWCRGWSGREFWWWKRGFALGKSTPTGITQILVLAHRECYILQLSSKGASWGAHMRGACENWMIFGPELTPPHNLYALHNSYAQSSWCAAPITVLAESPTMHRLPLHRHASFSLRLILFGSQQCSFICTYIQVAASCM